MHRKAKPVALVCVLAMFFVGMGCGNKGIGNDPVPPAPPETLVEPAPQPIDDYTPRILEPEKSGPKRRIAVARFNDRFAVEKSPFGSPELWAQVWRQEGDKATLTPKTPEVPARFTEMVVDELMQTRRFRVIERQDINAILREMTFAESRWVDQSGRAKSPTLKDVEWVITGSFGYNQNRDEAKAAPLSAYFRIYNVQSGEVVSSARITAKTVYELVRAGVHRVVDASVVHERSAE